MGKGQHLGDLEEVLLLAVLRLGEEAHGKAVRDELHDVIGRSVSVSTVYVTLMRLEEKGFATSRKGPPTAHRGGKAKRLYGVTPEGVAALEATRAARSRLWDGVPAIEGRADV